MAGLCAPLPAASPISSRVPAHGSGPIDRQSLHCDRLAPSTPCRSPDTQHIDFGGESESRQSKRARPPPQLTVACRSFPVVGLQYPQNIVNLPINDVNLKRYMHVWQQRRLLHEATGLLWDDSGRWRCCLPATDFAGVRSLIPFLDTTQLHVSAALGCVLS